jgi:hypothetical protein
MAAWLLSVIDTAAVAALLVAGLGWLLRNWISTRLKASIELETDQELARFNARLDAAEAQVAAVRSAGIDAVQQMAAATLAERVRAIREIWLGVVDWRAASALSTLIGAFDARTAVANADHVPGRRNIQMMLDQLHHMDLMKRMNGLAQWRPFVTERAWSLFAAYHGFYSARVAKASILAIGNREIVERLWQVNSELDIVRAAAPAEIVRAYEAQPLKVSAEFLAYLEVELLDELRRSLAGEHSGPEASRQAAKIVATVDKVLATEQAAGIARPEARG